MATGSKSQAMAPAGLSATPSAAAGDPTAKQPTDRRQVAAVREAMEPTARRQGADPRPQGSRASRATSSNRQSAAMVTIADLERQGRPVPAAYSHPASKPAKTSKSPEDMLAEVAAMSGPEHKVTMVSAKQCCADTAVSEKYRSSQAQHAQQSPASDTAGDSMEAHRRHLLDVAAARAAVKATAEQHAADANSKRIGKSKHKAIKPARTAEEKAASKAKAHKLVAAKQAEYDARARQAVMAKAAEAERQAAADAAAKIAAEAEARAAAEAQAAAAAKAAEERTAALVQEQAQAAAKAKVKADRKARAKAERAARAAATQQAYEARIAEAKAKEEAKAKADKEAKALAAEALPQDQAAAQKQMGARTDMDTVHQNTDGAHQIEYRYKKLLLQIACSSAA